jgi:hypothetical protein
LDWTTIGLRVLVAIVVGLISGAASFISRHWIEALLRGKSGSGYVSVVQGTWKGTFVQASKTVEVTIFLKSKLNIVYGEIKYEGEKLKCVGSFVQDRYLSLYYKNERESKLQHGNIVLLLSGNNDKLAGDFVGVGPISEKIVAGKIAVKK